MKIKKSQLKQIIKEEIKRVLKEVAATGARPLPDRFRDQADVMASIAARREAGEFDQSIPGAGRAISGEPVRQSYAHYDEDERDRALEQDARARAAFEAYHDASPAERRQMTRDSRQRYNQNIVQFTPVSALTHPESYAQMERDYAEEQAMIRAAAPFEPVAPQPPADPPRGHGPPECTGDPRFAPSICWTEDIW